MSRIEACIAALAAILLFWGLGDKYLWQDEGFNAVLSARLLQFGRPVAYDDTNLLTADMEDDNDDLGPRSSSPQAAIDYYIARGDFKSDFTWKWQPWGPFVLTAVALKILGHTTLAARLPFALAGIATVLALFRFARKYLGGAWTAAVCSLLLIANSYWILHARQGRYFSLSSLGLVLTLWAYVRWQSQARRGAALFVAAGWCWFQMDYGTVWPVFGILFLDAFVAAPRLWRRTAAVGAALAATLAPFVWYYELWHRRSMQTGGLFERTQVNLFNLNEYVVAGVVVLVAILLLGWGWKRIDPLERHIVAISIGILAAMMVWVPFVAPAAFLRYVIVVAPAGALVAGWTVVALLASTDDKKRSRNGPSASVPLVIGAAVLIVSPALSLPGHLLAPPPEWYRGGGWWRAELGVARREIFGHQPDPNRLVIEWLQHNAAPTDEILINYEDIPLMFYLPNPIRGGLAAFRAEDDSRTPPRFAIMRRSVGFVHWPVFDRELAKFKWEPVPVNAPDVTWGNNPDPMAQDSDPKRAPRLFFCRRVE